MVKINPVLCTLLMLIASCTPSPQYTINRKTKGETSAVTTEKGSSRIETSQKIPSKKPLLGTKIRGLASYYADYFHGKKTSNGETFDMHGLTAAHKTLPFNTWLEVKNLSNGRTVIVRVNDRGPFIKGRIIDLSLGAAKEIRMIGAGVQEVEIVIIQ